MKNTEDRKNKGKEQSFEQKQRYNDPKSKQSSSSSEKGKYDPTSVRKDSTSSPKGSNEPTFRKNKEDWKKTGTE